MATSTKNLELTKPELTDNLNPTIFADNFDIIDAAIGFVVTGTLATGETSLSLYDDKITANSTVDIYTSVYGVNPTGVVVGTGAISLTFDTQETDVNVKVRCW